MIRREVGKEYELEGGKEIRRGKSFVGIVAMFFDNFRFSPVKLPLPAALFIATRIDRRIGSAINLLPVGRDLVSDLISISDEVATSILLAF